MKNYKRIELLMPIWATLVNLLLAYGVYCLARVIYFLENYSYFSQNLSFSHVIINWFISSRSIFIVVKIAISKF